MKKIHSILFLIVGILTISSCGKNKYTIIEGHILEYGTDRPIDGATLTINKWVSTGFLEGYSFVLDSFHTDETGYFYWETDEDPASNDNGGWYELGVIQKDQYFTLNVANSGLYYQSTRHLEHDDFGDIYLDPYAWLHLVVEDVPEVEGNFCRFWGNGFNNLDDLNGDAFEDIFLIKGNRELEVKYIFDFEEGKMIDTLNIVKLDTIFHSIKY